MWLKRNPLTGARPFNLCIDTIFGNRVIFSCLRTIVCDKDILNMTFEKQSMWLRRNPVTVARHLDHCINTILVNKEIFSGNEIIIFCVSEFQNRGNHNAAIYVVDTAKIDVDDCEKVTEFIDKYIAFSILNESMYPVLNKLVKSVQTCQNRKICERLKLQGVDLKLGHHLIKHVL